MPDTERRRGLLKRTTVMELLDLGRKKVDSLRLAGEIKGFTIDGRWHYTKASVHAFIDRGSNVNTVALIAEGA